MVTIESIKKVFSIGITYSHPVKVIQTGLPIVDEHYIQAVADQKQRATERAIRLSVILKRRTYFKYFNVRQRYGISFKEFNRKVDVGVWQAWLAE